LEAIAECQGLVVSWTRTRIVHVSNLVQVSDKEKIGLSDGTTFWYENQVEKDS
jgi:hypothetical protein